MPKQVRAAGGVIWRPGPEVLLIHRDRYDDWSFPKGKAERGESDEDCALREVEEETGYRCTLGKELATIRYLDGKGRDKTVRYWAMVVESGEFVENDEVDRVRWVSLNKATRKLSYVRDVTVLDSFRKLALR